MFILANYEKEVRNYMNIKDLEPAKAVEHLVVNLRVMKDFYPISSEMNFRDLGQQWNNLPSDDRIKQQRDLVATLKRSPRSSRREA